nr:MAG TPA: hypothetical protein [Caudoviricetes sp.]
MWLLCERRCRREKQQKKSPFRYSSRYVGSRAE